MTKQARGGIGATLLLAAGLTAVAVGTAGSLQGAEPFATWYYPFAWYGTLAVGEAAVRLRTGRWFLLTRRGVALLLWSIPFWLLFELVNFRVENWYYVFVPHDRVARWAGIGLSFATVLPAILLSHRTLESLGVFESRRSPTFTVSVPLSFALQGLGVVMAGLSLARPTLFFPLVWGSVTLLVDPWTWRKDPDRSLLGRLARGQPGVVYRLLVGGLAIGFLWELFNAAARGKWIYTVPGLEEIKLFEMPVAGFLGFPVLALDGWAAWQALAVSGLAPGGGRRRSARPVRVGITALAGISAAAFSVTVLVGMERHTISSYTPRLEDVASEAAEALRGSGYDVFTLARATPTEIGARTGLPREDASEWIRRARLATLRGIGAQHLTPLARSGVRTVEDLAASDPTTLATELGHLPSVTPARLRVWVRAARRSVEE